ncbi:MAG: ATP-binding protein [Oligoflexales bacterium]|nr:ATP-binding protein [Oligoflexales bacterium]
MYIERSIENTLKKQLDRPKSLLLLGPRQTGKSTLLGKFQFDLKLSLVMPGVRRRYEKDPDLLYLEITSLKEQKNDGRVPMVLIDEIQKVPKLLDVLQNVIDEKLAICAITGSSARKLKRSSNDINLLPGRVTAFRLDPLSIQEKMPTDIHDALVYGALPSIVCEPDKQNREGDLESYVEAYLEEEIRSESVVRDLGYFSRFLEMAALESGNIINYSSIAREVGVSPITIKSYFELLRDCLVAERIDPITKSLTRKRLIQSSKWLFFDLGVRRLAAHEGTQVTPERLGQLFEQWVGLELIRAIRLRRKTGEHLSFFRDPDGPEVDWVVGSQGGYIPIEVKWHEAPPEKSAKHIETFLAEYKGEHQEVGYVVCRSPRRYKISKHVYAIPWQELISVMES